MSMIQNRIFFLFQIEDKSTGNIMAAKHIKIRKEEHKKRKTFYKEINKIINYIQNKTEFYQVMVKLKLSSIFLEESIIIF